MYRIAANFVENVRSFFSTPGHEQDERVGKLGNRQLAANAVPAPAPKASHHSSRNWFNMLSLRFRLPQSLTPSMPRTLVRWRATAAFKEALNHIKEAGPLGKAPRDFTKAVKAFARFQALIVDAPDREQMLEQIITDGFKGRDLQQRAVLLSELQKETGFYSALQQSIQKDADGKNALPMFCDEVVEIATEILASMRKFKG
ncbi:hypothetical protein [Noviherbaspirillum pedocola]|uniref:Uncharacterized protein n=1 Tax=Noviherbaspirillum pedocola TaxID=2801341 RepID=A0A934T250_9BURK|nr:hypothetical protein [Noviherbaspirillum pedocola]MBK4736388.1 hypothetical protein [Noviherbaspirillum pedocola]